MNLLDPADDNPALSAIMVALLAGFGLQAHPSFHGGDGFRTWIAAVYLGTAALLGLYAWYRATRGQSHNLWVNVTHGVVAASLIHVVVLVGGTAFGETLLGSNSASSVHWTGAFVMALPALTYLCYRLARAVAHRRERSETASAQY